VAANIKCEDLIVGLPFYDTGHDLIVAGGNYGCWLGKQYPDTDQLNSCLDDYQHQVVLGKCIGCILMSVCIRYPVAAVGAVPAIAAAANFSYVHLPNNP